MSNNRANYSGNNLYGGTVEHCFLLYPNVVKNRKWVYNKIFNISNNSRDDLSSIASPPQQVCLYKNFKCVLYNRKEIYAGQTFSILAVITGQNNGTVPGTVYAKLAGNHMSIDKNDILQQIKTAAPQELSYTIYSQQTNVNATLYLTVEGIGINPYTKRLKIDIHIKDCPLGYRITLVDGRPKCDCDTLKHYVHQGEEKISCSIASKVGIFYQPPIWIGVVGASGSLTSHELSAAVSNVCP